MINFDYRKVSFWKLGELKNKCAVFNGVSAKKQRPTQNPKKEKIKRLGRVKVNTKRDYRGKRNRKGLIHQRQIT